MEQEAPEPQIDEATHARLLDYLRELEQNIERQGKELRSSEQRYRELFEAEHKKARELTMLTEVGGSALTYGNIGDYLDAAVKAIQKNFSYFDVALFLVDETTREVVLRSQSGAYRDSVTLGYRQQIGQGIIGWVAEQGEIFLANDVTQEPRFIRAFPEEVTTRCELAVPIKVGSAVRGVIDVQSQDVNAFNERDVAILQTVAEQIATALENARLHQQTVILKELNEAVIASIPSAILVVNTQRRTVLANREFCRQTGMIESEAEGKPLEEVLAPDLLYNEGLMLALEQVIATGESIELGDVPYVTPTNEERVFEIGLTSLHYYEEPLILVKLRDVTKRVRRMAQLSLMHGIGNLLQLTLDLDQVLFTILTCITAGPALGFNRAFVMLLDDEQRTLYGKMAVGPSNAEEAGRIWREVGERYKNLDELVQVFDPKQVEMTEIQHLTHEMHLAIDEASSMILARVVYDKTPFKVDTQPCYLNRCYPYGQVLHAPEFAVAPLVAGNDVLGVVLADNVYSGTPIDDEDMQMLTTLCNQAGLALANAFAHEAIEEHASKLDQAYQELKAAQQELVRKDRLATVGEVAARVSHEIRNPLTTIGGFARSMLKRPEEVERVKHDASIIVKEVDELEGILRDTLDLTRPRHFSYRRENVNVVVEHACIMARDGLEKNGVSLVKEIDPDLPEAMMEPRQIQQAVLNVLRNAIQAMPDGGEVRVSTRELSDGVAVSIHDAGIGIPPDSIRDIFTPFYTTKVRGTGLGLAITKKIMDDHNGQVVVESKVGEGTVFTLVLPLSQPGSSELKADEFVGEANEARREPQGEVSV